MSRRSAPSTPTIGPWRAFGLRSRASVATKNGELDGQELRFDDRNSGRTLDARAIRCRDLPLDPPAAGSRKSRYLHQQDDLLDAVAQFGE